MRQCRNQTRPEAGKGIVDWDRCENQTNKTYTIQYGRGDTMVGGVPVCKDCAPKIEGDNPRVFKEDK